MTSLNSLDYIISALNTRFSLTLAHDTIHLTWRLIEKIHQQVLIHMQAQFSLAFGTSSTQYPNKETIQTSYPSRTLTNKIRKDGIIPKDGTGFCTKTGIHQIQRITNEKLQNASGYQISISLFSPCIHIIKLRENEVNERIGM
jgi:hypothetical protein